MSLTPTYTVRLTQEEMEALLHFTAHDWLLAAPLGDALRSARDKLAASGGLVR